MCRCSAPSQLSSASDILQPCILYCSWAICGACARSTRLTCGKQPMSEKKEPRGSWIFGIAGVVALCTGYALAVRMKVSMDAVTSFMLAVVLVVIGTYLVFIAFSIIFLKMLRKNKNFYYKRNHFISVSGMIYRMKQNGASLASICLLLTTALVAIVTTGTLRLSQEATLKLYNPYDVVMTKKTPISHSDK